MTGPPDGSRDGPVIAVSDAELADLRRRLSATKWPQLWPESAQRFTLSTSIAAARSAVRAELPSDATNVWFDVRDECAVEVLHSSQLAASLGSVIDDKSGRVIVEYFSLQNQYNTGDIERAQLEPGGNYPTPAAVSSC
jgi:hypothetical protein